MVRHHGTVTRSRLSLVLGAAALATLLAAATSGGSGHGDRAPHPRRGHRDGLGARGRVSHPGARRLARLVRRAHPGLFLYLGDVYETGPPAEFRSGYDPLYGPLAGRTLPTIGNHEYANRATGYQPYWRAKTGRAMPPGARAGSPAGRS